MYCLCVKTPVPYADSLPGAPETAVLVNELSNDKAVAILWFASSLVEEIGKTDSSLMKQLSASTRPYRYRTDSLSSRNKFHRSVVPNVDDIVPLLSKYLINTKPDSKERKARQESMRCLQVSKIRNPKSEIELEQRSLSESDH